LIVSDHLRSAPEKVLPARVSIAATIVVSLRGEAFDLSECDIFSILDLDFGFWIEEISLDPRL
jgi:hypothetical protein